MLCSCQLRILELNLLDRARTRELPDNYPFVVQQSYISDVTGKWLKPALILFDEVDHVLANHVRDLVSKHFQHFGRGNLERMVQ